jgi:hypothetical protein
MDHMDDLLRFLNMHWVFSIAYFPFFLSIIWYRVRRKEEYIYKTGLKDGNKDTPEALVDLHYVRFANFLIFLFGIMLPSLLWLVISFPAEGELPPISDTMFRNMLIGMAVIGLGIHFIGPRKRESSSITPGSPPIP